MADYGDAQTRAQYKNATGEDIHGDESYKAPGDKPSMQRRTETAPSNQGVRKGEQVPQSVRKSDKAVERKPTDNSGAVKGAPSVTRKGTTYSD